MGQVDGATTTKRRKKRDDVPAQITGEHRGVTYIAEPQVKHADVAYLIEKILPLVHGRQLRGDLTITFKRPPWVK